MQDAVLRTPFPSSDQLYNIAVKSGPPYRVSRSRLAAANAPVAFMSPLRHALTSIETSAVYGKYKNCGGCDDPNAAHFDGEIAADINSLTV